MAVHGVSATEDPALATMWASLGHANYGIGVPTWVSVSPTPTRLYSGDLAARANSLYTKSNEVDTQASVFPVEARLFAETEELLNHWRSVGTPSFEVMARVETRMSEDAYSLLNCLDAVQDDNGAPTVVMNDPTTMSINLTSASSSAA